MIARLETCLYSRVLQRTLSRGTAACLLCGLVPQGRGGAAGWRSAGVRRAVRVTCGRVLGVSMPATGGATRAGRHARGDTRGATRAGRHARGDTRGATYFLEPLRGRRPRSGLRPL